MSQNLYKGYAGHNGNSCEVYTGLTADTGSAQAGATQLRPGFNFVETVGTIGDSLVLPPAEKGMIVRIKNDAANSADVFPASGDTINGGSADTAAALAGGASITYVAVNTTNWEAVN